MRWTLPSFLLLALLCLAPPAPAQEAQPTPPAARRLETLRRTEQLAVQGRLDEAIAFLERRLAEDGFDREVARRLARLYREAERWEDLEQLLLRQEKEAPEADEVGNLRLLAEARFELGRDEEAHQALQKILDEHPGESSYVRLVASTLARHRRLDEAVRVIEEARERLGQPRLLAQQLASYLEGLGRDRDAAREYLNVVVETPLNVGLMRAQILDLHERPGAAQGVRAAAEAAVREHPDIPQLALILAELRQVEGEPAAAWDLLRPLLDEPSLVPELLQTALSALSESRLPNQDPATTLRGLQMSQRILAGLLQGDRLARSLQPRAFDGLNRAWLALLSHPAFAELDEAEQEEVLTGAGRTLLEMAERFPDNQRTTASLLRLAQAYVDVLHRPEPAQEIFRRIELDPGAGLEEIRLARLGLGRAYMAAGDTAQAREVFETMGRDMDFIEGQGQAHYQLGLLDFMAGGFQTAQERLSSVAYEAPTAPYTNEALDLAVLLATERMGLDDEAGLRDYGRALYFQAVARPDSQVACLERVTRASSPHLQGRALLDLARIEAEAGDVPAALGRLKRILDEVPDSKLLGPALDLKGDLQLRAGRPEAARAAWEEILLHHESYVFVEDVRDKLRDLGEAPGEDEGELP